MLLTCMQQAGATRALPVLVALTQKFKFFLIFETRNLISELLFKLSNDSKLMHVNVFTFTSFAPVLYIYMKWYNLLDCARVFCCFLGNGLSSFSFLLKMTDMAGIIHIVERLTYVISYGKIQTLYYQFYLLLKFVIQ